MVVVRSFALMSLFLALSADARAPGCGCTVSRCCRMLNESSALSGASVFRVFDALPGQGDVGYGFETDTGNRTDIFAPACSFLRLIPGAFEEGGLCSEILSGDQNLTLCDAISANEQAKNRLSSGRSLLSTFQEPGSCAQLEGDVCWEHEAGRVLYEWDSFDSRKTNYECLLVNETPTVAYKTQCNSDESEGLIMNAKWVDGKHFDACHGNYSGGLQVNIGANDWVTHVEGSFRWRCFDVPREQMGKKDYRIVVYSIGDVPCVSGSTTSTTPTSSSALTSAYRANAVMCALAVSTVLLVKSPF